MSGVGGLGPGVWDLSGGFWVWGLGSGRPGVWGLGCGILGLGVWAGVWGLASEVWGSRLESGVWDLGSKFGCWGLSGLRDLGTPAPFCLRGDKTYIEGARLIPRFILHTVTEGF